ncbi:COA8 family protein CG14806, mitochondrial [Tribolium castaneum]|uniref:APOPT family protein CG14806, mitochondrial-like Protein n=1 Tax=Tribolium castaneum TaxID=7070 RepID=A0A139WBW9_TRICA|nr:PREDICTED: APOPT family protein CG14806, mitochondrial [Tribolium castaneum]KYB25412.1 APOPT family protein CG14806, mitochondrial-like Protein [Tribolium castaneum]|eukprot:XP_008198421.1 PREDICTED: APOPT family protein CG14806, mitochondrial [Tribolium castaneum]
MLKNLKKVGLKPLILKPYRTTAPALTRDITSSKRSEQPHPVFLEKSVEDPVIVVSETDDVDLIGPPDPLSNLRPIIRKCLRDETPLQRQLRQMQDATQSWNHDFWAKHNTNFIKKRQEFVQLRQSQGEARQLTAEEMSDFYKSFLDQNWETHLNYNLEWYRRNFVLLFLAFRVSLEKNLAKFS